MAGASADAEVARPTAAHLRGQAIQPGELACQSIDPRRQAARGRLESIVHPLTEPASVTPAKRIEQRLDLARRNAWPARPVHSRCREAFGRTRHNYVQRSEAWRRLNLFTAATAHGRARVEKERHI